MKAEQKTLIISHPSLIEEQWDYESNNKIGLYPDKITRSSTVNAFWKCTSGHSWQATAHNRTKKNSPTGCPVCSAVKSFGEFAIAYYLKKAYGEGNVLCRAKLKDIFPCEATHDRRLEADIYVPQKKTVIEHSGRYHQKNQTQLLDSEKKALLEGIGCRLITVHPYSSSPMISADYYYRESSISSFEKALNDLFTKEFPDAKPDIDLRRDNMSILSLYYPKEHIRCTAGDPRLALACEWDFEKNCGFEIFNFTPHSAYYAHWCCRDCGHKWTSTVSNRSSGRGCPKCKVENTLKTKTAGLKPSDSFAARHPDKLAIWDYEKNSLEGIFPDKIFERSTQKVHWRCNVCNYSWKTAPLTLLLSKYNGCRMCGIEIARAQKFKPVLQLDLNEYKIIKRYPSISAAVKDGYKKVQREIKSGKPYKGFLWRKDKNE